MSNPYRPSETVYTAPPGGQRRERQRSARKVDPDRRPGGKAK